MSCRLAGALGALALLLTAPAARAATATVAPLVETDPKAAARELKYAFGKTWQAAIQAEVEGDLASLKTFDSVVGEGGDWTLTLTIDRLVRTDDERLSVAGKGTLGFQAVGKWSWSRGSVVKEGKFDVTHSMTIDRGPFRSDLEVGWREILRKATTDASSAAVGLP